MSQAIHNNPSPSRRHIAYEAYLSSLRGKIGKNVIDTRLTGLLSDNVRLVDLVSEPTTEHISRNLGGISTTNARTIAEAIEEFKKTHGTCPSLTQAEYPPELEVSLTQDAFNNAPALIEELTKQATVLSKTTPGHPDLSRANELALSINPNFRIPFSSKELRKPNPDIWTAFIVDVTSKTLIPVNHLLNFWVEVGSTPDIYYALINRGTWEEQRSYLDIPIWTADVETRNSTDISFTWDNYAFLDPALARADSALPYRDIILFPKNPFQEELRSWLLRLRISLAQYCEYFGVEHTRFDRAAHARNHIHIKHFAKTRPDLRRWGYALGYEALLKPSSPLRKEIKLDGDELHDRNCASWTAIVEYAGGLDGIISEVGSYVEDGKQDLGFCAFLDFLGIEEQKLRSLETDHTLDLGKAMGASCLLLGFGESLDSSHAIIKHCKSGPLHPALNALEILRDNQNQNLRLEP